MKHGWRVALAASLFTTCVALPLSAQTDPGVTLIGTGAVPGTALDLSGLKGRQICSLDNPGNCIDQATLGGFGSALTYTGHDNVFLTVPDRGPFDGRTTVPYLDRFNFMYLKLDPAQPFPNIRTVLLDTRFFRNEFFWNFVGDSSAFVKDHPLLTRRFDPEGVRTGPDGSIYVSDEYGPYLFQFDLFGHLRRRLPIPDAFTIDTPTGEVDGSGNSLELYPAFNMSGRQANRGMEGLAITPDGRTLVGIMQNALIQDGGLDGATPPGRVSLNNRIYTLDLWTGARHQYVYVLDGIGKGRGVNELIAVNNHQFLVLERDNQTLVPTPPGGSSTPANKKIYLIDLNKPGLTDISGMTDPLPLALGSIVPVDKRLIVDMLLPGYKVDPTHTIKDVIAEKIEGLAWGPDLPDGRHVLYVLSDNDLFVGPPDRPTQIYAFAIDSSAQGANFVYRPQWLPFPLYPPGLVKKQVK